MLNKQVKDIKKTYKKVYCCSNCGADFEETFDFGQVAEQPVCPFCGVHPSQLRDETYTRMFRHNL